jgi:hypothetical protein
MILCLACKLGPGYPKAHTGIGPHCPKIAWHSEPPARNSPSPAAGSAVGRGKERAE